MSKGDTPRPLSVSSGQYADNWARTFSKSNAIFSTGYDKYEIVIEESDQIRSSSGPNEASPT